jgi:hypothetical protein
MIKIAVPLALLATVLVGSLLAAPAQAQNRTYTAVSAAAATLPSPLCGSVQSPCHTLQAAYDVTAPKGMIDVLDPGEYGPLTIGHAISIQGHGWATVVAAPGGTAITVNAGPSDNINLRGVLLDGAGSGAYGIVFNSGATLNIQDSAIRNFLGGNTPAGILYGPNGSSQLFASNTLVSDNGHYGMYISNGGAASNWVNAVLDNVAIVNNVYFGVYGQGAVHVMVRNSTLSDNGTALWAQSVSNNISVILVTRSTITGNLGGWGASGGQVQSYGDNNIDNNSASNFAPPCVDGNGTSSCTAPAWK